MDEMNQKNVNSMIPQEIPIPDVGGEQVVSQSENAVQEKQRDNSAQSGYANGNPDIHEQTNQLYGQPNQSNGRPNQSYGQLNQPYSQMSQSNSQPNQSYAQVNQPYGQPNQSYAQVNQSYGQPDQSYGQMNQPYARSNPPYVQPYQPHGKKKSGKVFAVAACVIAVFVILGVSVWAYYTNTAVYKIAKGFRNLNVEFEEMKNPLAEKIDMQNILIMLGEGGSHVKTRMNFTTDTFLGTATLGVDTDLYRDVQAKELDSSTTISIMNYEAAHLNLYGTEEKICFSIPELFLEDMYFDTENVVSQYNDSVLADDYLFGKLNMEDFSIDLFPEDEEGKSVSNWGSADYYIDKYGSQLEACRENMIIEKVEKGLYRMTFTQQDTDRLAMELLHTYDAYGIEEIDLDEEMEDYDHFIASDVSFLFEINKENRIESITLENPIELLDGEASMDMELFFLGEERSIDKMQGKITMINVLGDKMETVCQLVQTADEDDYQVDMDIKYMDYGEKDYGSKMKLTMNSDASKDTFDVSFSMKENGDTFEMLAEGSLDDIVQGESFVLDLDEFTVKADGEQLFKITGDMAVEPLKEKITPSVKAENAIFEMSYEEIGDIFYRLYTEYGSLLDLLE